MTLTNDDSFDLLTRFRTISPIHINRKIAIICYHEILFLNYEIDVIVFK